MAEKDDLQNLGGDVGPPQRRFLLVLFSGLPDIVPSPRIVLAQLTLSNDAVNNTIDIISPRSLTVSAPADRKAIKESVGRPWFRVHLHDHIPTYATAATSCASFSSIGR